MKSYDAWTKLFSLLTNVLWVLLGCAVLLGVIWIVRSFLVADQIKEESDLPVEIPENVEPEVST